MLLNVKLNSKSDKIGLRSGILDSHVLKQKYRFFWPNQTVLKVSIYHDWCWLSETFCLFGWNDLCHHRSKTTHLILSDLCENIWFIFPLNQLHDPKPVLKERKKRKGTWGKKSLTRIKMRFITSSNTTEFSNDLKARVQVSIL